MERPLLNKTRHLKTHNKTDNYLKYFIENVILIKI